jgi:HK97 family phage portal protein
MSVWVRSARQHPEVRQQISGQLSLSEYLSGGSTYDTINVATIGDALRSIAVGAAADLFASLSSELPLGVFTGVEGDKKRVQTPGYLEDPGGDQTGREDWAYRILMSWLMRGNMMGEILDERAGVPVQVDVWHPDSCVPTLDYRSGDATWTHNGRPVDPETFVHRRVNPLPETVLGMSVISRHASQIALPLMAQRYGVQWFREGAHPSGVLSSDAVDVWALTDDQVRQIKNRFMAGLRGSREPALVGKQWSFKALQIAPDESQFLETLGASEAQCCRMFGPGVAEILGYSSSGSMTYSNVESRMTHLLVLSLGKWLRRLERTYSWMLPAGRYAVLNRDALLESTTLDRFRSHASALQNRWKVVNEVRSVEGLAPVTWGDEPNDTGAMQDPTTPGVTASGGAN